MYTSNRKNIFRLVTLQSFSISGAISAEKIQVENRDCMTGGMHHTPSQKRISQYGYRYSLKHRVFEKWVKSETFFFRFYVKKIQNSSLWSNWKQLFLKEPQLQIQQSWPWTKLHFDKANKANFKESNLQAWPWLPSRMFSPEYCCRNYQRFARKVEKSLKLGDAYGLNYLLCYFHSSAL